MKRTLFAIFTLYVIPCFAQSAFRVDPSPAMTVATNRPPGSFPPLLAIPGATISINTTTYTDATAGTACPSSAPVNPAGTSGCVATTSASGAFGFWLQTGSYLYTITTPAGSTYGPYPLTVGGSGGGGGGGSAVGPSGAIQFANGIGGFGGTANLIYTGGYLQSNGGFVSNVNSWQGVNSNTDGALLRAYAVGQTVANNAGGYMAFAPVTYNPYNGAACHDQWGNLVTQPLPLNGLSGFGPNDTIMWVSTSPSMPGSGSCGATLPVNTDYGLNINSYLFARAGLATDMPAYNSIQSLLGGAYVKLGYTADQGLYLLNHGASTSLNTPSAGYGALAYKSGSTFWYYNSATSAWSQVDFAAGGGGSTPPGGADTDIQVNDAASFGGFSSLTYNKTTKLLTATALNATSPGIVVGTGYAQADAGFLATPGTATNYNAIQAPGGGMAAKSFTATAYVQVGSASGPPTPTGSGPGTDSFHAGALSWDTSGTPGLKVYNGTSWVAVGGSGATTPGNPVNSVQINSAGSFGGFSTLTYTGQVLYMVGPGSGSAGLSLTSGFIQADGGFLTSASATNAIQAPNGGSTGKWLTATDSLFFVQEAAPALSAGGQSRVYMDSATHALMVSQNGAAYTPLVGGGSSGVTSLNGLNGALSLQSTANRIIVQPLGTTITLSTPQDIATTSIVNFQGVNVTSAFASSASGSSYTFQNSNYNFLVNGNGAVSAAGVVASTGGSGGFNVTGNSAINSIQTVGGMNASQGYQVAGTTVINSFGQIVAPAGINVGSGAIADANYNVAGGYTGQTWTVTFPGGITGIGGCSSGLIFRSGILVSCF